LTLTTFEAYPSIVLSNDKLECTVLTVGATIASVVLQTDRSQLNPLWNPKVVAAQPPSEFGNSPGFGHFVCVDGFGPASLEEHAAGLPQHGEAHQVAYDVLEQSRNGHVQTLKLGAVLRLVQESLTRTFQLVDGENVLTVTTELENLLSFDRAVNWAEHATIGPPFLERGKTVAEMPAARSCTRAHARQDDLPHRFASFKEFEWPMAPGIDGTLIDVRPAGIDASGDHTTCLLRQDSSLAFVTFQHPEMRVLLGYVFRTQEFPWVQNWEHYPQDGRLARGLEFATQPFDVPRRDIMANSTFFGVPTWRLLPARAIIKSRFLLFWTHTPDEFGNVADVTVAGQTLVIQDTSNRKLELPVRLDFN
jgi:hypothetical protein